MAAAANAVGANPMEEAQRAEEEDLYTKMKKLQTTDSFLTIQETYVKDETKNLR